MRAAVEEQGEKDLVIGIGNPLRGDDGVGWWLARRARRCSPRATVRLVQQVTPELALEVAVARRVLFVDAWVVREGERAHGACLRPLAKAVGSMGGGHGLLPTEVVALAGLLWPGDREVEAWELLVPAKCFDHQRQLSRDVREALPAGLELLVHWCRCGVKSPDESGGNCEADANESGTACTLAQHSGEAGK